MMVNSWGPIFNKYKHTEPPTYADFKAAFPFAIPDDLTYHFRNQFSVPSLTGDMLADVISNMKPSSPGADGWRVHELKLLGPKNLDHLAKVFCLIESSQVWPTSILEVPVAALKKGDGLSPLDTRPISLTSLIYRLWSKVRWSHLKPWHSSWLPIELKGGIEHRHAIDAYFEVALESELAQHSGHPLFGVFYDYAKCFDSVCWEIERGLLSDLGMPCNVLGAMFAFSTNLTRRFKIGNSIGPKFSCTNGICQGCPLAILRINALISSWCRTIKSHPDTTSCCVSAYIDDKNLRANSFADLDAGIRVTKEFDRLTDATVNSQKTHVFATTLQARKQLAPLPYPTVSDDRLLGGHLSLTKKRARALADSRASAFLNTAKRISMCPLNFSAKEHLLFSAGASKYIVGLELGPCTLKLEKQLRQTVVRALWSKGNHKSNDLLLTMCHKGHLFDPTQLKLYEPLRVARRQLLKIPAIHQRWIHAWHASSQARSSLTSKSHAVGPILRLQLVCNQLGWRWIDPFTFEYQLNDNRTLTIPLLILSSSYFQHIVRFAIAMMLWKRASNARKNLRGLQAGVCKQTTLQLLRSSQITPYECGILRAIFCDGVTTQNRLYQTKQALHPVCPFCWQHPETHEHLFWFCSHWDFIRQQFLSAEQIAVVRHLPLCTQRLGLMILTPPQMDRIVQS